MIINKTSAYTALQPSARKDEKSKNILEFNKEFNEKYANFRNENLILDFSNNINIALEEILLFSQKSRNHKKNNKSFIIVCTNVDIDTMTDEMIVVPTFIEAEDVIEIEEIERDLGI